MNVPMKKIIIPFIVGMLCLTSCDEKVTEKVVAPVLGEVVFDRVTADSIICHVEVTGGEATACGIYYDTSKRAVTNSTSKQVEGKYSGNVIQGKISGLAANKKYYIKVYGMNEAGISETEVVEKTTLPRTPAADDNKYPETQP